MRLRIKRPARRDIRNHLEFLSGGSAMEQAAPRKKTGRQKESAINDAVQKEARLMFRAELMRNRRGMVDLPGGGKMPFGLGGNGTGDFVGFTPVLITAEMIGRTLPIYTETEQKTKEGRVSEQQAARIEHLHDVNAICGVARQAGDFAELVRRWREKR
jgi:hypothetical protein